MLKDKAEIKINGMQSPDFSTVEESKGMNEHSRLAVIASNCFPFVPPSINTYALSKHGL